MADNPKLSKEYCVTPYRDERGRFVKRPESEAKVKQTKRASAPTPPPPPPAPPKPKIQKRTTKKTVKKGILKRKRADFEDVARDMQRYFIIGIIGGVPNDEKVEKLLEKHASRLNYVFDQEAAKGFVAYLTSLGVKSTRKLSIGQWLGVLEAYWGEISLDALYDRRYKHRPDPEYLVEDLINALDYVRDRGLSWADFGDVDVAAAARNLQRIARKDGVAISDYWAGIAANAWKEKASGGGRRG